MTAALDESAARVPGTSEEEPLLGQTGDASLPDGKPLYHNLILGTGVVAQAGVWILTAIIWGAVFSADLILFSAHPLLNSAALLFLVQGLLILQPTHSARQKRLGTYAHAALVDVGLLAALAGLVVIEYNKFAHAGAHFVSPHAILGLVTYVLLLLQALVGVAQFFLPRLFGGVENAKKVYKYHRVSGYVVVLLMLATVAAATSTPFNLNALGIQLWAVIVTSVITVIGLGARIRLAKFGWLAGH